MGRNFFSIDVTVVLFLALGRDKFAVETCDIAQRNIFGTFSRTCSGVGAVAETEFVHFAYHGACAACAFDLSLGQKCELADFCRYKKHCGAVLTSGHACAATYAGGRVHGYVGYFFRDGYVVCVGCASAVE